MQTLERLIVPVLGVMITLAAVTLGAPPVYKLLLGILGLVAAGTYFAPQAVQVETRVFIAATGLIILLMVTSTAFWLALLAFGAIAALQFPHRHALQRNPATIAWLSAVLKAAQARRFGRVEGDGDADEGGGAETAAGDGESRSREPSWAQALPGFVRLNVAGIGSLVAGLVILTSAFLPWVGFLASAYGELAAGTSLTLRAGAEELDLPALHVFFFVLLALSVLSIIAIGLHRAVAAIIAAAGLTLTLASYLYVLGVVEGDAAQLSSIGVGVLTVPSAGSLLAGFAFLAMFILQLIPKANRSRGARAG